MTTRSQYTHGITILYSQVMPLRALLLINQGSRQGADNARVAADCLEALGVDVALGDVRKPHDMPAEIRAHGAEVDVIVLGGGDGTLNLSAAALIEVARPIAVLPLGTANDCARTLLIPADLEAACRNVVEGVDHPIDLGQCNDVYFFNVASIGLAVRTCEYRSDVAKQWLGPLGYAANVFSAVRDTRPFGAEVTCGERTQRLHSIQIAIGNGRYFGGGMAVSSDAALDDGRLDVYSLKPQRLGSLAAMLPGLVRGPDQSMQGVQMFEGTWFEIRTDEPMDINTDGEILASTPASFRVLPRALIVKVPQTYVARYGDRAGD